MRKNMAKLGWMILTLAMLLAGCSTPAAQTPTPTPDDVAPTPPPYTWVVEPGIACDDIRELQGNYDVCVIVKDGKLGLIDYEGNIVLEPAYDTIYQCFCGDDENNIAVDDFVLDSNYKNAGEHPGHGFFEDESAWDAADNRAVIISGYDIFDLQYIRSGLYYIEEANVSQDMTTGEITITPTGRAGYVNESGTLVIPLEYEAGSEFGDDGLARVKKDGKWGYINTAGETVIGFIYDDASDFLDGKAAVCSGGKWGYIDAKGNALLAPVFDAALPINGDMAWVKYNGQWGILNCISYIAFD